MADHQRIQGLGFKPCSETMAHQLTGMTFQSQSIYQCPIDALNEGLQRMPGLTGVYASGYLRPEITMPQLSAIGEMVFSRVDQDKDLIKNYRFLFAVTDDEKVYYRGASKDFALHHVDLGQEFKIENIFKTPLELD